MILIDLEFGGLCAHVPWVMASAIAAVNPLTPACDRSEMA
jgi:hypothetical protein